MISDFNLQNEKILIMAERNIHCFRPECLMGKVAEYVEKEQLAQADAILNVAIEYYSNNLKKFQDEQKNLLARLSKKELSRCPFLKPLPKKDREFCSLAIFHEENPKSKMMYPKELVYSSDRDIQLEEIRAARYLFKKESHVIQIITSEAFFRDQNAMNKCKNKPKRILSDKTNTAGAVSISIITNHENHGSENVFSTTDSKFMDSKVETQEHSKATIINDSFIVPECLKPSGLQEVQSLILKCTPPKDTEKSWNRSNHDQTSTNSIKAFPKNDEERKMKSTFAPSPLKEMTTFKKPGASSEKTIQNEEELSSTTDQIPHDVPDSAVSFKKHEKEPEDTVRDAGESQKVTSLFNISPTNHLSRFEGDLEKALENLNYDDEETSKIKFQSPHFITTFSSSFNETADNSFEDKNEIEVDINSSNVREFNLKLPSSTPRSSSLFCNVSKYRSRPSFLNAALAIERESCSSDYSEHSNYERESSQWGTIVGKGLSQQVKLSTIEEATGEQSAGSRSSKKDVSSKEMETSKLNELDSEIRYLMIEDPFDDKLIQRFLNDKIMFPQQHHLAGYHRINRNIPPITQKRPLKLGETEFDIFGDVGKGNYGKIIKATAKNTDRLCAIKRQKPSCTWEYYISEEIHSLLDSDDKRQYFIRYTDIYEYDDGSFLISDFAEYGSILSFANQLRQLRSCPEAVIVHLSIQCVSALMYLHSCRIIHADVKPDNFVLSAPVQMNRHCVKLIDFGRSIDMKLFDEEHVVFTKVVKTPNFVCHEMQEKKPWTYQTDFFGLAGTMYLLIMGKYMETTKRGDSWCLSLPFTSRRVQSKEIWDNIFESLLVIPSCSQFPKLDNIRGILEDYLNNTFGDKRIKEHFSLIQDSKFRAMITFNHDTFISTICSLYGDFSDKAAHKVNFPIAYDTTSITQLFNDIGMTPDQSRIRVVEVILTPIPLP